MAWIKTRQFPSRQWHCFWTPTHSTAARYELFPLILSAEILAFHTLIESLILKAADAERLTTLKPVMASAPWCRRKVLSVSFFSTLAFVDPHKLHLGSVPLSAIHFHIYEVNHQAVFPPVSFQLILYWSLQSGMECKANHDFITVNSMKRWIQVACLQSLLFS